METMAASMLFSDSLKDLKNLRKQLYSAAEYFELSYTNDDQNHLVVNTLKDYAIKALVNTVDHLGSVTYKVNDFFDEKVDEVSGTELRVSCIEQRMRTCHEYIDREGISQQSLVINTPKYHKQYILPVGETLHGAVCTKSKYQGCNLDNRNVWHLSNATRAMTREIPPPLVSKGHSPSPSPKLAKQQTGNLSSFSSNNKDQERRTISPNRFPFFRSSSLSIPKSSRQSTPNLSRSTTPNPSSERQSYISEPRKSASVRIRVGKESPKDIEQYTSKSKSLLKALLSRRKPKKDDMLYTYLDEY